MRFLINQIQNLGKNKNNLLKKLVSSAPTLFLGYSGNDEDIFPIIRDACSNSPHPSLICIYPGSPKDEPIQQWNIDEYKHINRLSIASDSILRRISYDLMDKTEIENSVMRTPYPTP